MSDLTVKGKVHTVFPVETKSNFSFRMLWLQTEHESQYPQLVEIQFPKEKGDLLNNVSEGDIVEVSFNLRGRQWNDKVFNTVSGWRLNKISSGAPATHTPAPVGGQDDTQLPF